MSSSESKILLVTFLSTLSVTTAGFCATGREIRFEHLGVEHGLSDNSVYGIHQDIKGFMWFGTTDGLNRFDGYHFTVYRRTLQDSQSISINNVPWIFEDRSGTLWIRDGRGGNLNRFDRTRERFTRCLPNTLVSSIYEDAHGTLWFATPGRGLFRYDKATATFVQYNLTNDTLASICGNPDDDDRTLFVGTAHGVVAFDQREATSAYIQGGPSGAVRAMLGDRAGNVWIGTREELCSFNCATKTCTRYPFGRQIARNPGENDAQLLYEDREGLIWIGVAGAGIAVFDPSTRKYRHFPHAGYQPEWVNKQAICEDRAGELWVGTAGRGLQKYDRLTGSFSTYLNDPRDAHSLSSNFVNCIYEDRSGTLWIGTDTGGLSKIDPAQKAFHDYAVNASAQKGLTNNVVSGIAEDHSGMLWISTLGGLNRFDRSTEVFTHYGNDFRDPGSLSKNPTGPVLEDREGSLWVAAGEQGLEQLGPARKRFTHYMHDPRNPRSLGSNYVLSLCEDHTGGLWVGYGKNDGPLDRLDLHSGTVMHYKANVQDSNSFWGGWVWAIYEDSQAYIWICTGGGGLDRFDRQTGSFSHYLHEPNNPFSLSAGSIRSIHEDGGGTLWVGTTAGLNKFDRARGTFVQYTVRDGLESDHLGAILHDDNGCLWISTSRGISKFDTRTTVFRNYNEDDGVSIHPWYAQPGYRTRNGEMYFGGTNGFVRFHPDSIKDNPYVPPIVITAFKKFDNIVPLDSAISEKHSIEMSYKENVFSFEFAALNYTSPEKNQYAYKLEGFDNDWTYCRTRRYATYTNLDGGSYVFRVKGSNNDMVWNETGTSVQVIIRPPFWATWWFRIGFFVVVLLSAGGTIRYVEMQKLRRKIDRLERAQAIERERLRISQDMHDEVGATLTEIAILSELAKRNTPQGAAVADQVRKISDRSRQVIDDVSEIIWALNPKNDTLESMVSHLRHFAVEYCSMTSMRCQCDIPDSFPEVFVSSDSRRAMFLIVKEALHNAVKHSCATEVVVKIDATGETAEIQVGDNGKGFNPALPSTRGNGLTNMKSRAESLGGTLAIESPGRGGTMIRLRFPLAALRKE